MFDLPRDGGPNDFFEGPGRDNKAFPPPTFLVPSLMALEEDVNGSGAATLESFCCHSLRDLSATLSGNGEKVRSSSTLTFSHFLQTIPPDEDC